MTPVTSTGTIIDPTAAAVPTEAPPAVRAGRPAAILWDLDGTLVDTEPVWIATETELVTASGGTWTHEDALGLVGNALDVSARVLQGRGVPGTVEEIAQLLVTRVNEAVARTGPVWRPGARELVLEAAAAGIPQAIVTMSYRVQAEVVAAALPEGAIVAIVAGDMVTHGKPHPEPYLTGAALLGVDVRECIAVEDSATGVSAALASGARTVAVPHLVPVPERPDLSLVETLDGLALAGLAAAAFSASPPSGGGLR